MGGGVSIQTSCDMINSSNPLIEGGGSSTFRNMLADEIDGKEIYKNLKETHGNLRLNKVVNEGSVKGLAIIQLSQTLESNRLKLDSVPSAHTSSFRSSGSRASSARRQLGCRDVNCLPDNGHGSATISNTASVKPKKTKLKIIISAEGDGDDSNGSDMHPIDLHPLTSQQVTPPGAARLSLSCDAVHVDGLAIREKGIVGESGAGTSFLTSGRTDFVMIGSLGRGASGSVIEALHIPTLTIVALKMLPMYDSDNLDHIASEMSVLYQNLAKLKLIDNRLDDDDAREHGVEISADHRSLSQEDGDYTHHWDTFPLGSDPQEMPRAHSMSGLSASSKSAPSVVVTSCKQVLAMYDAFLDSKSGMVNLVVEYMDGGSLQDVVDGGGCRDEETLADIAYQVLLGLDFLHRNKQMHRDVKPGNILLNCQGEVKLADFGIAKAVDTKSGFGQLNSFVGTMCYMAPERISKDSYGTPGDIWSFGLTILAVVKGEFPLASTKGNFNYWHLLRVICEEEPPGLGPGYSIEFNMFINACLQQNPIDRPTVSMLLQHPFFVKHAKIVRQLSEDAGHSIALFDAPFASDDDDQDPFAYNVTSGERNIDKNSSSASGSTKTTGTDSAKQTRLSRLTSRTKSSAAQASSSSLGHTEIPSAIVIGDSIPPPSSERSVCHSDPDNDVMTAIRMQHLERVLEKTEAKYDHMVALYRREKLERKQQQKKNRAGDGSGRDGQGSGEGSTSAFTSGGSFRSVKSSRSFLKSANDPMTPVPNYVSGVGKWRHLAYQLQVPLDIVLSSAANILNDKYLAREDSSLDV